MFIRVVTMSRMRFLGGRFEAGFLTSTLSPGSSPVRPKREWYLGGLNPGRPILRNGLLRSVDALGIAGPGLLWGAIEETVEGIGEVGERVAF